MKNSSSSRTAIVVIAYNRLKSLKRLTDSLLAAEYFGERVDLIFSIDNSGESAIEDFAHSVSWPNGNKFVVAHGERLGLKRHVLSCGEYTARYDYICVFEDDLYASPGFFAFAKAAAVHFFSLPEVAGISLYSHRWNPYVDEPFAPAEDEYDVFFMKVASSWGQIWARDAWLDFESWMSGKSDEDLYSKDFPSEVSAWSKQSWLKFHNRFLAESGRYFVYPRQSLTSNFSDPGEHARTPTAKYQTALLLGPISNYRFPLSVGDGICYDPYFENEGFAECLGISSADLTVSLYGNRVPLTKYLLSTRPLAYEIARELGLSLRPWDANILLKVGGRGIYLYDTDRPGQPVGGRWNDRLRRFFYNTRLTGRREITVAALYIGLVSMLNKYQEFVRRLRMALPIK